MPATFSAVVLGDKLANPFSKSHSARGWPQQDGACTLEADCEEPVEQGGASPGLLCFKVLSTTARACIVELCRVQLRSSQTPTVVHNTRTN